MRTGPAPGIVIACLGVLLAGCAALTPPPRGERIVHKIVFASQDGYDLHLDIYLPAGPAPHPAVLWIHGGGWKYGHQGWSLHVRKLTRDGFAIVSVQYRLSGRAKFPAQIDDCRAALRWIERNGLRFGLDTNDLFLAGGSAGGHLAALLGLTEGDQRIRAVFVMYPVTDLTAFDTRTRRGYIPSLLGGPVEEKRALAEAGSPMNFVTPGAPPFLFLSGDRDPIVPIAQSQRLHKRLLEAGVESRLIRVRKAGHGFGLTEGQRARVADFFRRHRSASRNPQSSCCESGRPLRPCTGWHVR